MKHYMRNKDKTLKITFKLIKKEDAKQCVNNAFDLLFNEVFRMIKEKPIMVTN